MSDLRSFSALKILGDANAASIVEKVSE